MVAQYQEERRGMLSLGVCARIRGGGATFHVMLGR